VLHSFLPNDCKTSIALMTPLTIGNSSGQLSSPVCGARCRHQAHSANSAQSQNSSKSVSKEHRRFRFRLRSTDEYKGHPIRSGVRPKPKWVDHPKGLSAYVFNSALYRQWSRGE
jgi:hypothetical protein